MKRIAILTAGGDTPALNATIYGAVVRANQRHVEVYGFIKGFNSLFNPRVPHVHLNPLFLGFLDLQVKSLWVGVVAAVFQFIQSKQMMLRPSAKPAKQHDFASSLQNSMLYFSPLLTLAILPQLPAAVGLYWITTSVFSIWQQWYIMRNDKSQNPNAK